MRSNLLATIKNGRLSDRLIADETAALSRFSTFQAIGVNLTGTLAGKSHMVSVGVH